MPVRHLARWRQRTRLRRHTPAPTQVTVLDKSRADWKDFKKGDDAVEEELEMHKRSGDQARASWPCSSSTLCPWMGGTSLHRFLLG